MTVNRRSRPQRIQLSRRNGWRKPEGAIVVARPSRWGNPFTVNDWGRETAVRLYSDMIRGFWFPSVLERETDERYRVAYDLYQAWRTRIGGHPTEIAQLQLAGHNLGCWCRLNEPCHADALLNVANP